MEIVRQYIDAESLMAVMPLPPSFQNRKLEVLVLPLEEPKSTPHSVDVQAIVQSLIGAIPTTDLSLDDLRQERLKKYEALD